MKALNYFLSTLVLALVLSVQAKAQEQIAVPLSNPGEPGSLHAGIVRGSISVTGYDGTEVLINYDGQPRDNEREVTKDGLRRISNNSIGFQVSEDDNEVEISGASPLQSLKLDISVPRNFSLFLSTVNGGELLVENVSGEMELSNVNGDVVLRNVGGSAMVNTVNGDIEATIQDAAPNQPMAFSNLNGDIDITLPADVKMSAKMKSEWGEVFTDFDMDISHTNNKGVKSSTQGGAFKISINNWIYGTINGGGPEYLFKSMRGDIYIRKQ
ncbi:DUF4097 family beta strand repeat-containing protein [Fodinibius salsisoli]|uniref:DUF4097 family beta strand repeat protein n=1 Tax=Fodinibius salsisoli TaxID=2820877 RepID=A0ABT3PR59_9BACT|nr:DUF4097 family beta strand repeat-containing protein [Fodinibius salsisoli]MCW9708349.1 DUF4097 family beta strand repeat protein [Fodinibius salsisoli]